MNRHLLSMAMLMLCLAAMPGCSKRPDSSHSDTEQDTTVKKEEVYAHLADMRNTKQFGEAERKYMQECAQSDDFTLQARLSPLLSSALEIKAVTPEFAAQQMAAMKVKAHDAGELEFWAKREQQFRDYGRK